MDKTILSSIIELSGKERRCSRRSKDTSETFECTWRMMSSSADFHSSVRINKHLENRGVHCVSNSLRPLLYFFRVLALFPTSLDRRLRRRKSGSHYIKYFLYANYIIVAVLINLFLIKMNLRIFWLFKERFGLMHTGTVASMITGTKPVISVVVIIFTALKFREHQKLLKTIDMVDVCFRSAFSVSPPLKLYKSIIMVILVIVTLSSVSLKVIEHILTEQKFGDSLLMDASFILVPILSLWNIIPLLYYNLFNVLIRFYCRTLIKSMNKEHKKRHFSLKFYYEQFMRITNVQEAVGNVFNPLLLFFLAWSLLVLCLTIYFLSEPTSNLRVPITAEQVTNANLRNRLNNSVFAFICWSTFQIVMAILHIVIICATGFMTNESTRQIVNAVLKIVPDVNADLDRFQISCFVHKMTTQFMWGMTVWRAFPLERTTFFTLISVIVTYSLLLFRFKDDMGVNQPTIMIFNTTNSPKV